MGAVPVGCYKQMSAIKKGVIKRLQCIISNCRLRNHLESAGLKLGIWAFPLRTHRSARGEHLTD